MNVRDVAQALGAIGVVVLATSACRTRADTSADGGVTSTPPVPARGERRSCGSTRDEPCRPGEVCLIDTPSCHGATGFCGDPSPKCYVMTAFCGCGGTDFACTWPTSPWMRRGAECAADAGSHDATTD
ncbi:hypothetical protein BH09MYX1_BH09MYX1_54330 [soil metagenome]